MRNIEFGVLRQFANLPKESWESAVSSIVQACLKPGGADYSGALSDGDVVVLTECMDELAVPGEPASLFYEELKKAGGRVVVATPCDCSLKEKKRHVEAHGVSLLVLEGKFARLYNSPDHIFHEWQVQVG